MALNQLITVVNPESQVSENYRKLRTNIQYMNPANPVKVILVASASKGEGRTTTASNLAVAYAEEGKKVVILDADLRHPALHEAFGLTNQTGVSHYFSNPNLIEFVKPTKVPGVSIIAAGPVQGNPGEILTSDKLAALFKELRNNFDVVIVDSPPVLDYADAQILATLCDGVLLVVSYGRSRRKLVKKAKANLEQVHANILGAVLNNKNKIEDEEYSYKLGSS